MFSDSLHRLVSPSNDASKSPPTFLVYMIPGNPGLIEYYRQFLDHLATNLASGSSKVQYVLGGRSLGGFELSAPTSQHEDDPSSTPPFNLQEQVSFVESQIKAEAKRVRNEQSNARISNDSLRIILIGHSIGAYILLEVIARWQAQRRLIHGGSPIDAEFQIAGGICLFPTIVDIAKSPSGRKVLLLANLPGIPSIVHIIAKIFCFLLPSSTLQSLVQSVTGMPSNGASVTTAFLQSRNGVRQALHLGKHELNEVTQDKWDEEHSWNISPASSPSNPESDHCRTPKLFFFWGENDHWVDNGSRDAVIASRARRADAGKEEHGRPWMEVDETGLPHGFCLRHNEAVAEKVAGYIEEIVRSWPDKGDRRSV